MVKNERQKAVGNYLVVVLPPIFLGLLIGLFAGQRIGWLGPTAVAGLLLGITTAVLSVSLKNKGIRKLVWWLHTLCSFAVASYSIFHPLLIRKEWSKWIGIAPGLAVGLTVIALSLIALGARDLGKRKHVSQTAPQPKQPDSRTAVTERAQVNLFTPRNRETQGVDVTRTLEDIGHGARADLLTAANQSRAQDLKDIEFFNNLVKEHGGDTRNWPAVIRRLVIRNFSAEVLQELDNESQQALATAEPEKANKWVWA